MKRLLTLSIFLAVFASSLFAQSEDGMITGEVLNENEEPLPNTSVAVYDSTESDIVTGASSSADGTFNIDVSPGNYIIKITFISYKPFTREIQIESGETTDVGSITMEPTAENMEEIFVRGERSEMEMDFDRRSFQVGEDITSLGGSAVEVLNNVPSIATDIDGNISLRGNQAVRVLINGKPSSMVSGDVDALRSIPATMIEEVEIITNPSAKYAAEGSAGIINIILKKERDRGLNGSVSAGGGLPEEYEASTNLNYRVGDVNYFFNGGIDYRSEPESGRSFQRFAGPDTTYMYSERTDASESEIDGDLQFGADFHLSESEVFTASVYMSAEEEENIEDITYTDLEYSQGALNGDVLQETNRENTEVGKEKNLDFNLDYENKIDGDDHKFVADASFDISSENAQTDIEEVIEQGSGDPLYQRSEDIEKESDLRFNAEYVRPLGEHGKFEAGLRSDTEWMDTDYGAETLENGTWISDSAFTNNFKYTENVNAAFVIIGAEFGDFSGQIGLRAENTNIRTEIKNLSQVETTTDRVNTQNYTGLFPSAFLNYSFNEQQSIQISYSRRLSRPWSRSLIPFVDFEDNRSQFIGNPNLRPEYSNSYEAGYLHYWNTGSLLTSFYYRHRTDVRERITEQRNGVLFRFPINFATEKSWGIELSADQEIANSLNLNANANLFQSNTEGTYENQVFSSESDNVRARMRLRWEIVQGLNYQASMRYRGPSNTPQGTREGMTMMDTGIAKDFMDGKAKVSLNVRDVFNAQNFNNTVTTDGNPNTDFYSEREFSWSTRSVSINFQYFFGDRENRRGQGGGGPQGGEY